MKKHILPISNIILLIILLYNYLVGDLSDNKMGWTIFVLLLLNTFWYWKKCFYKSDEDIKEENRKKSEEKFKKEGGIHIELHTDFYKNGQKKFEGSFKDGEMDGLSTTWYENGQKSSQYHMKDGKFNGLHTGWYDNGQKSFQSHMKDSTSYETTYWERDGQKTLERSKNRSTEWYKNGQKMFEKIWEKDFGEINPKLINFKEWNEDGSRKENKRWNEDGSVKE